MLGTHSASCHATVLRFPPIMVISAPLSIIPQTNRFLPPRVTGARIAPTIPKMCCGDGVGGALSSDTLLFQENKGIRDQCCVLMLDALLKPDPSGMAYIVAENHTGYIAVR